MDGISDAIEQLYSAFAIDTPSNIAGCPCCISDDELI